MATLQELRDELANAPSVLDTTIQGDPPVLFAGLRKARILYVAVIDGIAHAQAADAIVVNYGEQNEAAYWLARLPQPLVDNSVTYFADRTASTITLSDIIGFVSMAWRHALGGAQTGAPDAKDISVSPKDGSAVQVSGLFYYNATKDWKPGTFIIRLKDANGSINIADGNIVFEKVSA